MDPLLLGSHAFLHLSTLNPVLMLSDSFYCPADDEVFEFKNFSPCWTFLVHCYYTIIAQSMLVTWRRLGKAIAICLRLQVTKWWKARSVRIQIPWRFLLSLIHWHRVLMDIPSCLPPSSLCDLLLLGGERRHWRASPPTSCHQPEAHPGVWLLSPSGSLLLSQANPAPLALYPDFSVMLH